MGNNYSQLIDDFCTTAKRGNVRPWVESLDSETRTRVSTALSESGIVLKFPKAENSSGTDHSSTEPLWPGKNEIENWSTNVESFWNPSQSMLQLNVKDISCSKLLGQIYKRAVSTDIDVNVRLIQRRHIQLFWHEFFKKAYPQTKRGDRTRVTTALCQPFTEKFYLDTGQELETVTEKVVADTIVGKKYQELTQEFGLGILVVLPAGLEKHLTTHGSSYSPDICWSSIRNQRLDKHAAKIGANEFSKGLMASISQCGDRAIDLWFNSDGISIAASTSNSRKRKRLNDNQSQPEPTARLNVGGPISLEHSSERNFQGVEPIFEPQIDIDTYQPSIESALLNHRTRNEDQLDAHIDTALTANIQSEGPFTDGLRFPISNNVDLERRDFNQESPFFIDNLHFQPDGAAHDLVQPFYLDGLNVPPSGGTSLGGHDFNQENPFFIDNLHFQPDGAAHDLVQPFYLDGLNVPPSGGTSLGRHDFVDSLDFDLDTTIPVNGSEFILGN